MELFQFYYLFYNNYLIELKNILFIILIFIYIYYTHLYFRYIESQIENF